MTQIPTTISPHAAIAAAERLIGPVSYLEDGALTYARWDEAEGFWVHGPRLGLDEASYNHGAETRAAAVAVISGWRAAAVALAAWRLIHGEHAEGRLEVRYVAERTEGGAAERLAAAEAALAAYGEV